MLAESLITLVGLMSFQAIQDAPSPAFSFHQLPVAKYVAPVVVPPIKKNADAYGMEVTAKAAVVIDVASGEPLFRKNADMVYPVASLTKLLTAMTFLDTKPNLQEEVEILPEDDPHEGKSVFAIHERLSKQDVLRSLLVGSVNASANALARSTGSREAFIRAMNEKARALGMTRATFTDPVGLGADNQASAEEIALALRAALSYPEIREASAREEIEIKGRVNGRMYQVKTTNLLLKSFLNKDPYHVVAGKTGSLPEAGFCLAQATRDEAGHEVIAVVLGSENHFVRFQDAKALTAWAFMNFEWPKKTAYLAHLAQN